MYNIVGDVMHKSVYNILGKNINFANEYEKIYEMFNDDYVIIWRHCSYSWASFFEKFIDEWKYRSIYTTVEEC